VRPAAFSTIRSPKAPSSRVRTKPSAWPGQLEAPVLLVGDQKDGSAAVPSRKPPRPIARDTSGRAMLWRRSARRGRPARRRRCRPGRGARARGRRPQLAVQDGAERRLLPQHALHQDAVAAAQVAQDDARLLLLQDRVAPGDGAVEEDEVARGVAAEGRGQLRQHRLAHDPRRPSARGRRSLLRLREAHAAPGSAGRAPRTTGR
jgi:hypothetical protein